MLVCYPATTLESSTEYQLLRYYLCFSMETLPSKVPGFTGTDRWSLVSNQVRRSKRLTHSPTHSLTHRITSSGMIRF
ncbi:hypothetical protein BDQ94DRAFT_144064 [Aspergillus welwitschiae]|uniref:Uncharacterized protein n=1 Tax=Aspergillus welwitschiae TaxID=1341132 RepID=A0A3F3Q2K2_9EURO|nr:hypothetical protein BDQ94DRAFT_144064 [Aspergillus welwitschiae]RDH33393.1 hypothetical protein BDQ94DRAFT_144064 [Aspergillus welwitschiae]